MPFTNKCNGGKQTAARVTALSRALYSFHAVPALSFPVFQQLLSQ